MTFSPVPHTCRSFLNDFSAFVDGQLPARTRDEYQAHVDCCQSCLAHLAAYRRGITVLRSLEEAAPTDFWTRLEQRLWVGPELSVVDGGAGRRPVRRAPHWSGPAVSLAAAAVLALFFIVRGLGPGTPSGEMGPRTVLASVGITLPEVPRPAIGTDLADASSLATTRPAPRRSGRAVTPVGEPAVTTLAQTQSASAFEREIRRLQEGVFRQSLGRAAESRLTEDGWVQPVRLGNEWSRATIIPASLVRPASAVRPAPWNVDQAVSLP